MHELAIVDALIDQVRGEIERAGAQGRVTRLDLAIGRLSGVCVDSIRFAFEMLSPGTILEKAQLAIREPPATGRCSACGAEAEIEDLGALCPRCTSPDVFIEGGRELVLESIELEEAPPRGE